MIKCSKEKKVFFCGVNSLSFVLKLKPEGEKCCLWKRFQKSQQYCHCSILNQEIEYKCDTPTKVIHLFIIK